MEDATKYHEPAKERSIQIAAAAATVNYGGANETVDILFAVVDNKEIWRYQFGTWERIPVIPTTL